MGAESSHEDVPDPSSLTQAPDAGAAAGSAQQVDVFLNVYNIAQSGLLQSIGLGLFHSGIEIYGKEWSYGGTTEHVTGVFWLPPKTATADFKESIRLGAVSLCPHEIQRLIDRLKVSWLGPDYNILTKNCNHFSQTLAEQLGFEVPDWVNRAARFGDVFLPDSWLAFIMENFLTLPQETEESERPPVCIPDNLEHLSVRELKTVMFLNNIDWKQCVEKEDLVYRIEQHRALIQGP